MPPANRHDPIRAKSSQSLYSLREFLTEFPDDEACLQWLWRERYSEDGEHAYCPKCEQTRRFKRYETAQRRQSWTCTGCGHHVHPTAGTIFAKSSRPLTDWFYVMFLVASSRCGVAAKQVERELGCNYRTAWRMLNKVRNELMSQDGDRSLTGEVEADETFIGGKLRESDRAKLRAAGKPNRGPSSKTRAVVMGLVERKGNVRASVIARRGSARGAIHEFVLPGSIVYTDDWGGYDPLSRDRRYTHRRIQHSAKVYVSGETHTQTIEGFFGHFKTDVRGTHHSVSTRWLQGYLNEWVWRWNRRTDDVPMFKQLITAAAVTT